MEIVGTLAAIVGIIDVTTRSISALTDSKAVFMTSNHNLETLLSHLVTVRAALGQVHALVDEQSIASDDHNYQLVMDLGIAIKGCGLLVAWIDEQVAKIRYDNDDALTLASKFRLLLNGKATGDCLGRLDRKVNALTLLFTTFRCCVRPATPP